MKAITESLYAIVVPEEAQHPYISGFNWLCYSEGMHNIPEIWLGEERFEILGTVSQDTITFDVEEIVESIEVCEYKYGGELHPKYLFLDYESKTYWLESYEDSFRSLLTSKGINIEENNKLLIIKKL